MDYHSFLTKDFKKKGPTKASKNRLWFRRSHFLLLLSMLVIMGIGLSLISLNARATHHIQSLTSNPTNQITVAMPLPTASDNTNPTPDAPTNEPHTAWIAVRVKSGDTLAEIFKQHHLAAADLYNIMQASTQSKQLRHLIPGQTFRIELDEDDSVQQLRYHINQLETFSVTREGDAFIANYQRKDVEKRLYHATAMIDSSMFEAGQSAGLSNQLIMELAHIFGWDIDFAQGIRKGDSFSVVYEQDYLNGNKVNDGPILAAEFTTHGHTYRAIRYTDPSGHTDYYNPNGNSMRKAFLRTPVAFTRISSKFGMRYHPILHRMRMHTGVDYAAPRGTPIKATGDGKIIFIGRKGGYGNAIIIKHTGVYSTLYGHMAHFRRGMHRGKWVKQGQVIGYVGSTGLATGPHLHYEFRINGVFRNPLTVKLPDAHPIKVAYKPDFERHAQSLLSQLTVLSSTLALNH